MPETPKIIEIKDVTVFRDGTRVFDGLTLDIDRGHNTAVLGPNGAGKTTLLQLISRHLYPVRRSGSYVRVLGQERWNVVELRDRLGIVSPELQLQYQRDVLGDDVVLSGFSASIGIYPHRTVQPGQRERAQQTMLQLRCDHLGQRLYTSLSVGEQRRLLLARALVSDPHTLLLDEPTAGLDLRSSLEVLELLRGLARMGTTLILITHRVEEIPPEVDRVILLKDGRVWLQGAKRDVLTSENLGRLFGLTLELIERRGSYSLLRDGRGW